MTHQNYNPSMDQCDHGRIMYSAQVKNILSMDVNDPDDMFFAWLQSNCFELTSYQREADHRQIIFRVIIMSQKKDNKSMNYIFLFAYKIFVQRYVHYMLQLSIILSSSSSKTIQLSFQIFQIPSNPPKSSKIRPNPPKPFQIFPNLQKPFKSVQILQNPSKSFQIPKNHLKSF